ncbi:MAG TPA: twin-arginine translocase TatA/TatE family subunit [Capsulimonadaceae bacterium]
MIQPVFANLFALENPTSIIIIALVVILLFGGQKLSTFGKSLGEGMREFKKATRDEDAPKEEAPKTEGSSSAKSDKE